MCQGNETREFHWLLNFENHCPSSTWTGVLEWKLHAGIFWLYMSTVIFFKCLKNLFKIGLKLPCSSHFERNCLRVTSLEGKIECILLSWVNKCSCEWNFMFANFSCPFSPHVIESGIQTAGSNATRHLKSSANLSLRKIHDNDFTNDFETTRDFNKFLRKRFRLNQSGRST